MIGVVVWSSADREKAVIWCDDQGALAYLQGRENLARRDMSWPEAGDLMELETEFHAALRHARQVALLSDGACHSLPDMLRRAQPAEGTVCQFPVQPAAPTARPERRPAEIFEELATGTG